ncbi:N5-glutamine methyltransferase family protein [Parvibacter caecicola]|uniref:Release factor glutamine methyltransferase n=1 Tax=Parvibacter caecicola TaxID=747645 RepID=A0A4T9T9G6_9ACTN|nr:HemK/PrmC family methyltransferase [Parvibacter caecicola]TJW12219.1 peptide chain release factor N(5)-glutamine methyltransferase [Parvibacter caecicola]
MEEWTIKAALDWTVGYLERKGDENPRLAAEWLLSAACAMPRIQLYVNFDRALTVSERDVLRGYVQRRAAGEPLQYITGEAPFRHITVKVAPGVLIPRPETEVLVSEALALLPSAQKRIALDSTIDAWEGDLLKAAQEAQAASVPEPSAEAHAAADGRLEQRFDAPIGARAEEGEPGEPEAAASSEAAFPAEDKAGRPLLAVDLCAGSGCIAVSLAVERPDVRVLATDISPQAVQLACENARRCEVEQRVKVVQCHLAQGVPAAAIGRLDLVVSNPPYVPSAQCAQLPSEVRDFEPSLALDGGADGLQLFREIAPWALRALKPGGGFACELFEGHMDQAASIAREAGFGEVRIVEDLTGRPRVLAARKPQ